MVELIFDTGRHVSEIQEKSVSYRDQAGLMYDNQPPSVSC